MESYFMGIDTGTQGVRVGICNQKGEMVISREKKWDTMFPKKGYAEQPPEQWWQAILEVLDICFAKLSDEQKKALKACCVCATSSTVFPIDRDGNPMADAMMWMDARSAKEMDEINATKHEVLKYCGEKTSFEWMIPKLLWIKRNRRELYDGCYKVVEQLDWINFRLCGVLSSSICNTTCKWNYVKSMGGYQKDFFEQIGLGDFEEKLVTHVDKIGEELGCIRKELAEKFGINPDMKVVQGGIDAHMAMFGLDVVKPNKLAVIMGTSFVHLCLAEKKIDMQGIWGPYDSALMDDMWLFEGGQISAAGLVNWFRKNFHIQGEDGNDYAKLIEAARNVPPGSEGIVVLDFFQGNRTPYKDADAKGVIYGLNIKHTWEYIYRAVIESVAYGTNNIIKNFEKYNYAIDSITACGGVTKDAIWMQIISDVTGKRITVNKDSQAGVLGCCVVAAAGGREYDDFEQSASAMVTPLYVLEPDQEKHELYKQCFAKYLALYDNLKDMMAEN